MQSSLLAAYNEVLSRLGYGGRRRGIEEFLTVLEETLAEGEKPFIIFKAPTGYGKTTASVALGLSALRGNGLFDKVIHVLPLRSIVSDAYDKAGRVFSAVGKQMMGVRVSPFLLFPLTFVTVDTFLLDAMKLNTKKIVRVARGKEFGYDYFTQASILSSLVVFDEAHMVLPDEKLGQYFFTVLCFLLESSVPVVLESATLPSKWVERKLRKLAEDYFYKYVVISVGSDDEFYQRELSKSFRYQLAKGDPSSLVKEGMRNLIIVNSVERATEAYKHLKERFDNVFLLHGRFAVGDKEEKMKRIKDVVREEKEYYIVATQVAEAGLDVSSDVLVTDVSPAMSLIQRFGRNARYGEKEGMIYIIVDADTRMYRNQGESLKRTFEVLYELGEKRFDGFHPRIPEMYQFFLDKVYGNLTVRENSDLLRVISDPLKRSVDVADWIKRHARDGFLRNLLISIRVDDDILIAEKWVLEKLAERGAVEIRVEGRIAAGVEEVVRAALDWRNYEVVLKDKNLYSRELGLVI